MFSYVLRTVVAVLCDKILKADKNSLAIAMATLTQIKITSNNKVVMKLQTGIGLPVTKPSNLKKL